MKAISSNISFLTVRGVLVIVWCWLLLFRMRGFGFAFELLFSSQVLIWSFKILFFFRLLPFFRICHNEQNCTKDFSTVLLRMAFLTQPGLEPAALGIRDHSTDHSPFRVDHNHLNCDQVVTVLSFLDFFLLYTHLLYSKI